MRLKKWMRQKLLNECVDPYCPVTIQHLCPAHPAADFSNGCVKRRRRIKMAAVQTKQPMSARYQQPRLIEYRSFRTICAARTPATCERVITEAELMLVHRLDELSIEGGSIDRHRRDKSVRRSAIDLIGLGS